jgi:mono/diheme cytochrome c family protein
MRSAPLLLILLAGCNGPAAVSQTGRYDVGRAATADEIAAVDDSVFPDGRGLPAGHGTAREGKPLFAALCASCHGPNGEGNDDYPQLVGGRDTLGSPKPVLTVGSYWPYSTTVWDYVHRAMPYVGPGALTPDQVYALTAFLLHANGIITEEAVLDERRLPAVQMPNRNGFTADRRPDVSSR